jgi:hypothetical protein
MIKMWSEDDLYVLLLYFDVVKQYDDVWSL